MINYAVVVFDVVPGDFYGSDDIYTYNNCTYGKITCNLQYHDFKSESHRQTWK